MPVEPDAFRAALGRFPSGVTVVTLDDGDGGVHGITVSSFVSLSLNPPLVGVAIGRKARAHGMIGAPSFAVSVLAADQAALSDHFAARPVALPADPFEVLAGHQVVRGAAAPLVCEVVERFDTTAWSSGQPRGFTTAQPHWSPACPGKTSIPGSR